MAPMGLNKNFQQIQGEVWGFIGEEWMDFLFGNGAVSVTRSCFLKF